VVAGIATNYFRVLTQVHAAEDLLGESFPSKWRQRTMNVDLIDAKGGTTPYRLAIPIDKPPTKIEGLRRLLDRESLREWRYRGARMFLARADVLTDALVAAARRGVTIYD